MAWLQQPIVSLNMTSVNFVVQKYNANINATFNNTLFGKQNKTFMCLKFLQCVNRNKTMASKPVL